MNNLNNSLSKKLKMSPAKIKNLFLVFIAFFSLLGFIDSAYITVGYYLKGNLPCSILNGCDKVLGSSYSKVFGVPISLIGVVYYLILFFITFSILLEKEKVKRVKWVFRISFLGLLASAFFVYLQVFVLKSLCFYCLISAFSTFFIFILSFYLDRFVKNYEVQF